MVSMCMSTFASISQCFSYTHCRGLLHYSRLPNPYGPSIQPYVSPLLGDLEFDNAIVPVLSMQLQAPGVIAAKDSIMDILFDDAVNGTKVVCAKVCTIQCRNE